MATFSVTDRATYRRCRRKWDLSSNMRRNLTMVGSGPEPLELGGLIHRALADWIVEYNNGDDIATTNNRLAGLFLLHAIAREEEVKQAYTEHTGRKTINPDDLASLHNVVELGMAMMRNYQEYHKSPIPSHMSFAVPEQEVLVPVPGTEHQCEKCAKSDVTRTKISLTSTSGIHESISTLVYSFGTFEAWEDCEECKGLGYTYHYLSATLDGLLQDDKEIFYVLEHKTYSQRPDGLSLTMNDQFTGYCWVVRELKMGRVGGVAYDGMWKKATIPKTVTVNKVQRKATMDDLFIRLVLKKTNAELDAWGENLAKELNEMANNPPIYPNVQWNGCNDCSFINVCLTMLKGEDPTYTIETKYTQREVVRGGSQV